MLTKEQGVKVDEYVIAAIRNGRLTFRQIAKTVFELVPEQAGNRERAIDRSLQRLRAAGKIHFLGNAKGGGWRLGGKPS